MYKCINEEVETSKEHVVGILLKYGVRSFSFNINLSLLEIFAFYASKLFEGSRFQVV